jgi:hypothetical protein
MTFEDDEIEDVRTTEQAGIGRAKAKRETRYKRRALAIFSEQALKAIKNRDARAFEYELRRLKVPEGSEAWRRAWKIFSERT